MFRKEMFCEAVPLPYSNLLLGIFDEPFILNKSDIPMCARAQTQYRISLITLGEKETSTFVNQCSVFKIRTSLPDALSSHKT